MYWFLACKTSQTRCPLGPGQGPDKTRNAKFIIPHDSATCPHILERFLSLSLSPRNASARFGAFGREGIFRVGILVQGKIWMRKWTSWHLRQAVCIVLRTSSGHPAYLQCLRIFRKRSWRLPRCGQLRECLGNLPESTRTVRKTSGANKDPTYSWSGSCRESCGSSRSHAEAMHKPWGRHEAMRTPRGCHGEGFRIVPNGIGAGDRPECGALRTYVRQDAKSSIKNVYFVTFVTNDNP